MTTPKDDKHFIHLDPTHMGVGDILTEITRAYLYTGNPSAFIHRLIEGVSKYRTQTEESDAVSKEDRRVMAGLEHHLRTAFRELHKLENDAYSYTDADIYEISDAPATKPPPVPKVSK